MKQSGYYVSDTDALVDGRQAAAPRGEPGNVKVFLPQGVDNLHGLEVVDARVQSALVQEHEPFLGRLIVQRSQLIRHIARRHHVLAYFFFGGGGVERWEERKAQHV